jgi:hypothetical protein
VMERIPHTPCAETRHTACAGYNLHLSIDE